MKNIVANPLENAFTIAGSKIHEMKWIPLTKKMLNKLETKSLQEVLAEELPASDLDELRNDACDLEQSVDDFYSGLSEELPDNFLESMLNKAMAGRTVYEQGNILVGLLKASISAGNTDIKNNETWKQFEKKDMVITEGGVSRLMEMVKEYIPQNAEFLATKEYEVMSKHLDKIPGSVIEEQMNSGRTYAIAYAASIYISERQNAEKETNLTDAKQIGYMAAGSVESSYILAQCHLGKLRWEKEALPRIKRAILLVLANVLAIALQAGLAAAVAMFVCSIMQLFITNVVILVAVPMAVGLLAMSFCDHEEIVEDILSFWDAVKSFIKSVFDGSAPGSAGSGVVAHEDEKISTDAPVNTTMVNPSAETVSV